MADQIKLALILMIYLHAYPKEIVHPSVSQFLPNLIHLLHGRWE